MGILSTEGTLVGRSSLRKTELIHSFERDSNSKKKNFLFFAVKSLINIGFAKYKHDGVECTA